MSTVNWRSENSNTVKWQHASAQEASEIALTRLVESKLDEWAAGDHSAIETIANLGVPHPDVISLQQFVRPICAVFTAENGYKVFYPLGFLDQTAKMETTLATALAPTDQNIRQ